VESGQGEGRRRNRRWGIMTGLLVIVFLGLCAAAGLIWLWIRMDER